MTPEERAEKMYDELWAGVSHEDHIPNHGEQVELFARHVREAVAEERERERAAAVAGGVADEATGRDDVFYRGLVSGAMLAAERIRKGA